MTTEDMLRRALRDEAAALVPSSWPAGPVRAAAQARVQRRRARRAALAVAVAVAVPAAVVGVLVSGGDAVRAVPAGRPPVAASVSDSPSPTVPWPPVQMVTADRKVPIGRGQWLLLRAAESCEGSAQVPGQCSATAGGNQSPDSVSLRTSGDSTGTFFLPQYVGSGQAARMTVTVAGQTHRATVLSLPGRPGYATGYVWIPGISGQEALSGIPETVTVYDASGTVLAELPPG